MVVHTNKGVLDALKVISDTCKNKSTCEDCPFGNDSGECFIGETIPSAWEFNEPDKTIWRAFV